VRLEDGATRLAAEREQLAAHPGLLVTGRVCLGLGAVSLRLARVPFEPGLQPDGLTIPGSPQREARLVGAGSQQQSAGDETQPGDLQRGPKFGLEPRPARAGA
jgi:hypothetical protein